MISFTGLESCRPSHFFTLSEAEGLPHTFACSTIGPAGLNLRRLEGVSEAGAFCRNPEPRSVRRRISSTCGVAGIGEGFPRNRKRPPRFLSMAFIYAGDDRILP